MTTIDQIKEAAIEAACKMRYSKRITVHSWETASELVRSSFKREIKEIIDAYEAAMNQQPENAPMDELVLAKRRDYLFSPNLWIVARRISAIGEWQCVYGTRYQDREILYFRPLPQPPVSAAIRAAGEGE